MGKETWTAEQIRTVTAHLLKQNEKVLGGFSKSILYTDFSKSLRRFAAEATAVLTT